DMLMGVIQKIYYYFTPLKKSSQLLFSQIFLYDSDTFSLSQKKSIFIGVIGNFWKIIKMFEVYNKRMEVFNS
ncbi:MAG: hypothetical protein K2H85_07090, partial [Allobaculum sp.]|nr:hypothetical protein [Allobaculum sp.]